MYTRYETEQQAKRAERAGSWKEAAALWRSCGNHAEAKTCDTIAEAIRKGNVFRAIAKRKLSDAGLHLTDPVTPQHQRIIYDAHAEVYGAR
jgi:hypothetical protein